MWHEVFGIRLIIEFAISKSNIFYTFFTGDTQKSHTFLIEVECGRLSIKKVYAQLSVFARFCSHTSAQYKLVRCYKEQKYSLSVFSSHFGRSDAGFTGRHNLRSFFFDSRRCWCSFGTAIADWLMIKVWGQSS